VVASPKARAGIPISVKLIVATSIVVAAAVGAITWRNQLAIDDLAESQTASRRKEGERAITRESELLCQAVAIAAAHPLAQSQYPDIDEIFAVALRDDVLSGDKRVQWMLVRDTKVPVRATKGAPTDARLDELERMLVDGVTHGDVVHARSGADWIYGAPIKVGALQIGSVRIGVSTAELETELARSVVEAEDRARAARDRGWLIAIVVLGIGIILAALQGIQLARPIKQLTMQARRIAGGDLGSRVPEARRDELGELARTFNFMTDHIVLLLNEQVQKVSLEKEMELARQVQQAMLPPSSLDEHGFLRVIGYCRPASQCGGDWWMYRKLANGRMLLVVGDATGHGIHSAMIAATARGAVEALATIDERLLAPDQVLRAIDQAIRQVGDHNVLMTAFAAAFDSSTGVLTYANAGQNFPYVMKLGATRVLEQASIIAASGNPLGDRHIAVEIRRGSLQLGAGDLFVCFTDGVVERANPAGKLFGDRRLRGALAGQPLHDAPALIQLRDRVVTALDGFGAGTVAEDDITLVLCQFDPPQTQTATRSSVRAGRGVA
jgi:serine phosphatase RsbU (regulator of sigma subunit)